jgi:hypothetical protein
VANVHAHTFSDSESDGGTPWSNDDGGPAPEVTGEQLAAEAAAAAKAEQERLDFELATRMQFDAPRGAVAAPAAPADSGPSFTLEELQAGVPDGVDPLKKETFLSDADFQTHFGMDKAAFAKMPGWKAKGVKTKLKLF